MDETTARLNESISRVESEFCHEVNVRTAAMVYMLDGVHQFHLRVRHLHPGAHIPFAYPALRSFLVFGGESWDDHSKPGGFMEAAIGKWWLVEVFGLWENRYRSALQDGMREAGVEDAIRGETDLFGDLRLIRNDQLHGGTAQRDGAAGCKLLRWFREGDAVEIRLAHVLDFFHQWGMIGDGAVSQTSGRWSQWVALPAGNASGTVPPLVSVRAIIEPDDPLPYRHGVSVVFADGVHGLTPVGPLPPKLLALWPKLRIGASGDLELPGRGTVLPAADLYENAVNGEKTRRPGLVSPRMRFRRPPDTHGGGQTRP